MLINWPKRMSVWLDKRIPAAKQFQLDMRSIFIFPSKFGVLFFVLCLGLFILGTNYQNNLMLLLCFFLLSLMLLNLFVAYLNFAKLNIQLGKTTNIYAGEQVQLPVWFNHDTESKGRPHGVVHIGFWRKTADIHVDLDSFENPNLLAYTCQRRGKLSLPRITFSSLYPLGLFRCWTHLGFQSDIVVYPKPIPSAIELHEALEEDEAQSTQSSGPGYDDFDSLKTYRAGEPLYHVAWKHYAKGQGMFTKQFSSSVNTSGWLRLLPCSSDQIETKLGQLCHQVNELTRKGQTFGLDLGNISLEPQTGHSHQQACLKALANFTWQKP